MMARVMVLSIFFSFICNLCFSQVKFIYQDLEKAKQEARVEGRYILVDVYADWCSWCKKMDAHTFHDKKVSDFVNNNMVALKLHSEKGIGREIAAKYGVSGLPTILYLNYKGELIEKKSGYKNPDQIMLDLEPYFLPKAKRRKSLEKESYLEAFLNLKVSLKDSLWQNLVSQNDMTAQAYQLAMDKKTFDFEQLKNKVLNKQSSMLVSKLDVFYLLGKNKSSEALSKIKIEHLIAEFSLEESHFIVTTLILDEVYSLEMLQIINEHSVKTIDLELLNTKAYLQYKLGDVKDAKDTIFKINKLSRKSKTNLSNTTDLLEKML